MSTNTEYEGTMILSNLVASVAGPFLAETEGCWHVSDRREGTFTARRSILVCGVAAVLVIMWTFKKNGMLSVGLGVNSNRASDWSSGPTRY